jgi:hypothetical protein
LSPYSKFDFVSSPRHNLSSPLKQEPMVPRATASGMLHPRLRGDDSAASYKPNTNSMVAFLARFFNSGELAIRPIWLRVRPVAIAMYCLPSTA